MFTSGTNEKPYQTKILYLPKFLFHQHILFYQAQEKSKKKKKEIRVHCMKACSGSRGIPPLILNLRTK